jgi:hypothetical protein
LKSNTVWLARFGDKNWRNHEFHATLEPRLDRAIEDWHADHPLAPKLVVDHEPPNDDLQTGKSRLLGGAMSIHAPWTDDAKQNPPS